MSHHVTPARGGMVRTIAGRMAQVFSELIGHELALRDVDEVVAHDWLFEASDDATPRSRIKAGLGDDDARALAGRVRSEVDAADEIAEILSRAWTACLERFDAETKAAWSGRVSRSTATEEAWSAAYRLETSDGFGVTAMFAVESGLTADAARPGKTESERPGPPGNLEVILDIDLPLSVRFGSTDMTIDALTRMGPGALIDLGRSPDEPVDVMVNGRMVARGEVVVVGGNYGVRVTEVVSAADRLRSMGM